MDRYPEPRILRSVIGGRIAYRFLTGRPLDWMRRTDAVFHRAATRSLDPSGHATRWSRLPGYQRLLVRLAVSYVFVWVVTLSAAELVRVPFPGAFPSLTVSHVLIMHGVPMAIIGTPIGTYLYVRAYGMSVRVPVLSVRRSGSRVRVTLDDWVPWVIEGRRDWDRRYVRPLAVSIGGILGVRSVPVEVPRSYRDPDGPPVIVSLPASFSGADAGTQKRLAATAAARLGLRDPIVAWDLEGPSPRMLVSSPVRPPDHVTWEDVREHFEQCPEYRFILGCSRPGQVVSADLKGDSPHVGLSAGSSAGKSEQIKATIMLALHWGWSVIIMDWKVVSHSWARGLPGVTYVSDIEDLHDMGERLGQEVESRKRQMMGDPTLAGRKKVLVVAEEMNITAPALHAYWANLRSMADSEEKKSMPIRSPGLDGIQQVVFAGRQLGMFAIFVAQRFSSRVTSGNSDLRENFRVRLIHGGSSRQTWAMLAPQIKPVPKMDNRPGLWAVVIGNEVIIYQAPLIEDDEARSFVLDAGHEHGSAFGHGASPNVPSQRAQAPDLGEELGDRPAPPSQPVKLDARKLSEMVDGLEHLGITLAILQHAAKDSTSGFPGIHGGSPNRGYTYDYEAVKQWARKRQAAIAAKREAGR